MKINFVKTLKEISKAIPYLQEVVMGLIIMMVVVGVTLYQVTSGNISVPSAIETFLNSTLITSIVSFATSLNTGVTVVLSLLVVVVVIFLLGRGGKGDKKKGNSF